MERKELKEFMTFIQGINPTRAQKQFENQILSYYDQASFDEDFSHQDIFSEEQIEAASVNKASLKEGDIVISNSLQRAAMVGKSNTGKVLSLNFTKVELDHDRLDSRYFLYLFNAFKGVKVQKERELQGNGSVRRIPINALERITIPIVSLEEQKRIGAIYTETLKIQSKLSKYAELIEQFTTSIIEESLKEESK